LKLKKASAGERQKRKRCQKLEQLGNQGALGKMSLSEIEEALGITKPSRVGLCFSPYYNLHAQSNKTPRTDELLNRIREESNE